jgi:hypothetical protein
MGIHISHSPVSSIAYLTFTVGHVVNVFYELSKYWTPTDSLHATFNQAPLG